MLAQSQQSKIPKRQASTRSLTTGLQSPQAKASPSSKIPSRPKKPQASRSGWKPIWKKPGSVDGRPATPEYRSPGLESPSKPFWERAFAQVAPSLAIKKASPPSKLPAPTVAKPKVNKTSPRLQPQLSESLRTIIRAEIWHPEPLHVVMQTETFRDSDVSLEDIMRYMNPNVDRSPAQVGEPCDSKLVIKLINPYGNEHRTDMVLFNESGEVEYDWRTMAYGVKYMSNKIKYRKPFVYPKEVDFSEEQIHLLNRWREAIFERYLGPATKIEEVRYGPLEDAFLLEKGKALERAAKGKTLDVGRELPSWAGVARDFNATFRSGSSLTREQLRMRYLLLREGSRVSTVANSSNENLTLSGSSAEHAASCTPEASSRTSSNTEVIQRQSTQRPSKRSSIPKPAKTASRSWDHYCRVASRASPA